MTGVLWRIMGLCFIAIFWAGPYFVAMSDARRASALILGILCWGVADVLSAIRRGE